MQGIIGEIFLLAPKVRKIIDMVLKVLPKYSGMIKCQNKVESFSKDMSESVKLPCLCMFYSKYTQNLIIISYCNLTLKGVTYQ